MRGGRYQNGRRRGGLPPAVPFCVIPHPDASGWTDIFPTFVTPDDAKRYIAETDTGFDRLQTAIASSSAAIDFKTGWGVELTGWKTFAVTATAAVGWLNTKAVMDQTDRWAAELKTWRDQFVSLGGKTPDVPGPGQGVPTTGPLGSTAQLTSLAFAVAAAAAIFIFGPHLTKGT